MEVQILDLKASALVGISGRLPAQEIITCYHGLSDEYLRLSAFTQDHTLEQKISLFLQERFTLIDKTRKSMLEAWSQRLLSLSHDAPEGSSENTPQDITSCIELLSLNIIDADIPIQIFHRAAITYAEQLRKAHSLLVELPLRKERLKEDEMWWGVEQSVIGDKFLSLQNFVPQVEQSHDATLDAKIRAKKACFDQIQDLLKEDQAVTQAEGSGVHELALLVVQRALFQTVGSVDYKAIIAARQVATQGAMQALEAMAEKTRETIAFLEERQKAYAAEGERFRQEKQAMALLRARLRRLGSFELKADDEKLLYEFDQASSSMCCIA